MENFKMQLYDFVTCLNSLKNSLFSSKIRNDLICFNKPHLQLESDSF